MLRELALVFLALGATSFGGPAVHIARMQEELVVRRAWLTSNEFLDLLGAANLIPGPNSTELAIHIGHRRAGFAGLVVAGVCFILPAALITYVFAWAYVRFGSLPRAQGVLYGVKPAILAVVVQALYSLSKTALKDRRLVAIGVVCLAAAVGGLNELVVLLLAGTAAALFRDRTPGAHTAAHPLLAAPLGTAAVTALGAVPVSHAKLFFVFLKIGSVLFGSGYVLLAFLRADLVTRLHWLTEGQLMDAVAVGQFTPGPVFTTATFIGYVVARGPGAALATCGIFLPAFVFVALSGPLVPRIRRSPSARAFLDGVNVASLVLMACVTFDLGRSALLDLPTVLLGLGSALLLLRFKLNSAWLVLGGAMAGLWLRRG